VSAPPSLAIGAHNDSTTASACPEFRIFTRDEARKVLHGARILVIGDSVSRRVSAHMKQFIMGDAFGDSGAHTTIDFSVNTTDVAFNLTFLWQPLLVNKTNVINSTLLSLTLHELPHVIVIGPPDHDFMGDAWEHGVFYEDIAEFTASIDKLSRRTIVLMDSVFRFSDSVLPGRNAELKAASILYRKLFSDRENIGFIDLWDWVSAHKHAQCTVRDKYGIHFKNDDTRLVHVQELFNFIRFFYKDGFINNSSIAINFD